MNPLIGSFIPMYNQPHIGQDSSDVSALPQEFLTEGEYMSYEIDDEEKQKDKGPDNYEEYLSRGELIRRDLAELPWMEYETEHFIFNYLPDGAAAAAITDIAEKREAARAKICDFFFIAPPDKATIYIFNSDKEAYCPSWGKTFASRALPEEQMAGILYMSTPDSYEQVCYGHELTHLMEFYFLPYLTRVPPYFREGMADFMSQSGLNMHLRYLTFLKAGMVDAPFSFDEETVNQPEYMESASLLQYISELYGMEKLNEFYRGLGVLQKGETLSKDQLESIATKALGHNFSSISASYYNYICSIWNCETQQLPKTDQEQIKALLPYIEEITKKEDQAAINKLYGNDFYYTTPQSERDLFIFHMMPMEYMHFVESQFFDPGTWTYGKTAILRAVLEHRENKVRTQRAFLFEKSATGWRLSPKYPGGKEING